VEGPTCEAKEAGGFFSKKTWVDRYETSLTPNLNGSGLFALDRRA
jgi:hypothetical protein